MSPNFQLCFLGTGTSSALPLAPCLTLSKPYPRSIAASIPSTSSTPTKGQYKPDGPWPTNIPCASCRAAVDEDVPEGWKNRRGNPSLVLRKEVHGRMKNVVVDVGKTFREQAVKFFPRWGVQTIDAVLLTHGREWRGS
jgi:hypothetical protein